MVASEMIAKMSHREFTARLARLDKEWDTPDKHDYYLMRIAHEVKYVISENRPETLDEFKLTFSTEQTQPKRQQMTKEQRLAFEQDKWLASREMATGTKRKALIEKQRQERLARQRQR